jgi:hypothetical protein
MQRFEPHGTGWHPPLVSPPGEPTADKCKNWPRWLRWLCRLFKGKSAARGTEVRTMRTQP